MSRDGGAEESNPCLCILTDSLIMKNVILTFIKKKPVIAFYIEQLYSSNDCSDNSE